MNTPRKGQLLVKKNVFTTSKIKRIAETSSVVVIGLGRFGRVLALELEATGTEVLGIDTGEEIVQSLNGQLTKVVRADSTKMELLEQLSVGKFDCAVVSIGSDIQSSILTASLLIQLGIPNIWAKAVNDAHGQILTQLGVHHVVYPEKEMGRRVAHLVRGAAMDFMEVDKEYAIVKMAPNSHLLNITLGESNIRKKYGITVLAVRREGTSWIPAESSTVLTGDDIILVGGQTREAENFSQLR
jgi:trk system potassium uptake protein TrkA